MENHGLDQESILTLIIEYLSKEKKITPINRHFHPIYGKPYFNGFLPPEKQNNYLPVDRDNILQIFSG
jgi:hypothetical protein